MQPLLLLNKNMVLEWDHFLERNRSELWAQYAIILCGITWKSVVSFSAFLWTAMRDLWRIQTIKVVKRTNDSYARWNLIIPSSSTLQKFALFWRVFTILKATLKQFLMIILSNFHYWYINRVNCCRIGTARRESSTHGMICIVLYLLWTFFFRKAE